MSLHNIASIHQTKGDPVTALELYRKVLPVRETVHGSDDPYVANTLTGLGETLVDLDRPAEAIEPLERALRIRDAADPDPKERARTRFALARAQRQANAPNTDPRALAETALAELQPLEGDALAQRKRNAIEAWLAETRP
jgi:eukaryotic-like serine/threonine-protein kinase